MTLAEYHEQEEIFKLRLGHLKKVSPSIHYLCLLIVKRSGLLWIIYVPYESMRVCECVCSGGGGDPGGAGAVGAGEESSHSGTQKN